MIYQLLHFYFYEPNQYYQAIGSSSLLCGLEVEFENYKIYKSPLLTAINFQSIKHCELPLDSHNPLHLTALSWCRSPCFEPTNCETPRLPKTCETVMVSCASCAASARNEGNGAHDKSRIARIVRCLSVPSLQVVDILQFTTMTDWQQAGDRKQVLVSTDDHSTSQGFHLPLSPHSPQRRQWMKRTARNRAPSQGLS